jgi:hypothetical protein
MREARVPQLEWKEMETISGLELCAMEYIKPLGEKLQSGVVFRISHDDNIYLVCIFHLFSCTHDRVICNSLEEAKKACELYRRHYLEGELQSKIIVDDKLSYDACPIEYIKQGKF